MVEILIDGTRCDLEAGYTLPKKIFTLDGEALQKASKQQSGRSVKMRLLSTPCNDTIMLHAADPCAGERFNDGEHTGEVKVDGVTLLRGVAHLLATEVEQGHTYYVIRIRDGAGDWAESAARTDLKDTQLEYSTTLNEELIESSWSDDVAVRFLPVRHDDYTPTYDSTSLFPPQRVMTVSDYHPFISLNKLLRAIFAEKGYEVVSDFMQSEEFLKLHISGCYASAGKSATKLNAAAGFLAGRESEPTAEADFAGRVWLTPLVLTSSLGNFVESAEGGSRYNNNDSLTIDEQGVTYRPPVATTAGFELRLKYTTDYRITSEMGMQGFDALYIDSGCDFKFNLTNIFPDRRNSATAGIKYRCVVFDYEQNTIYRLLYTSDSDSGILTVFTVGSTYVTIPNGLTNVRCTLQRKIDNDTFVDMNEGWSLYDGYVEDEGEVEVDVTVRTSPELISPTAGKSFARMYLHGAAEGQRVKLSRECTLRPIFSASPGLGSQLTFADVAQHGASQLELIEAVQQMFNLRIATNPAEHKVYIEPHDDFYNGACYDWSAKVEMGGKIEAEQMDTSLNKMRTLCYRAEVDGAVGRYNVQNETKLGEWSTVVDSHATLMGRERRANALFCPTLSAAGIHASAPSALIMQVGDRDSDEVESVSTRIVRYEGLRALPEGEVWSFPSYAQSYPFAAFHAAGEFTLCFEDRDGEQGLHRYYDNEWRAQQLRERLTLDIRLAPHEVAEIGECGAEGPNIRSRYRLNIAGQGAEYNLAAVESYDAGRGVARCQFVRRMNDN